MKIETCSIEDGDLLAEIRALAMRESLEAVGRYCPIRVKDRFLSSFLPSNTYKVISKNKIIAFYVLIERSDHFYLDHLYVHPNNQGKQVGAYLINRVLQIASDTKKPVRLGALKESKANKFYLSHGFVKTHEEEFDNYYTYEQASNSERPK